MKPLTKLTGFVALAVVPFGMAQAQDFSGDAIELRDFIATTQVIVGDSDEISVAITPGAADKEPVLARLEGDTVVLYSEKEPDKKNFWRNMNWERHGEDAFKVFLRDYPTIQVTVPQGTDVTIDGIASHLTIDSIMGDFVSEETIYVEGTVGSMDSADVHITGSGELAFASIANDLKARISGSGDLSFDTAASAELLISGSGDIDINEIADDTSAKIRGSGDIDVKSITGGATLDISGSGDIKTGKVGKGVAATIKGSGDIEVAELNGPSSASITGNGDIKFRRGRAEDLEVRITGSGDFEFGGLATNPSVRVGGSGDVTIDDYEGSVNVRGGGDVRIGDLTFER